MTKEIKDLVLTGLFCASAVFTAAWLSHGTTQAIQDVAQLGLEVKKGPCPEYCKYGCIYDSKGNTLGCKPKPKGQK